MIELYLVRARNFDVVDECVFSQCELAAECVWFEVGSDDLVDASIEEL